MGMKFDLNKNKQHEVEDWVRDNLDFEPKMTIEKVSVNYGGLPRIEYILKKKGDTWELIIGMHGNKTLTLEVDDGIISEEDAIMFMLKYS